LSPISAIATATVDISKVCKTLFPHCRTGKDHAKDFLRRDLSTLDMQMRIVIIHSHRSQGDPMPNSESRLPVATLEPSPRHGVPQPAATIDTRTRIDSADLLRGGRELLIAHAGEEYRLRLTRNNKLILTK